MDSERRRSAEAKTKARERLGLPTDDVLILTAGTSYKYLASNGLDFIGACEDILSSVPEAFVIAVGPEPDERWNLAGERTGSRLRAVGTLARSEVSLYHQAADIFIEGFPFGTTTALLEAGLQGIPVVLAPALCPPPYATDGVAVDDSLERPRTVEEFKAKVIHLISDPVERCRCGETIRESIKKHHTGAGWTQYFETAIGILPREHKVLPSISTVRTPQSIHEYWSEFVSKWTWGTKDCLEESFIRALLLGIRPRLTREIAEACGRATSATRLGTIPLPFLTFLCNGVMPLLPIWLARSLFRLCASLFRGSLLSRLRGRFLVSFRRKRAQCLKWGLFYGR